MTGAPVEERGGARLFSTMRTKTRAIPLLLFLVAGLLAGGCRSGPVTGSEVDRVVGDLGGSAGDRARAEKRLAQTSPTIAWKPLLAVLEDRRGTTPEARSAAIRIIAQTLHDPEALPGAVGDSLLVDPDVAVRRAALRAVAGVGNPRHFALLERAEREESDAALRSEIPAARKEWEVSRREFFAWKLEFLQDEGERILAARGLGDYGTPEDVAVLKRNFEQIAASGIRYEIVLSVMKLGGPEANDFLLAQLQSSDPYVRTAAAFSQTQVKDPRAVPTLKNLLAGDSVGDTRISSARALRAIDSEESREALQAGCTGDQQPYVAAQCRLILAEKS